MQLFGEKAQKGIESEERWRFSTDLLEGEKGSDEQVSEVTRGLADAHGAAKNTWDRYKVQTAFGVEKVGKPEPLKLIEAETIQGVILNSRHELDGGNEDEIRDQGALGLDL